MHITRGIFAGIGARALVVAVAAVCLAGAWSAPAQAQSASSVPSFRSDAELRRFLTDREGHLRVRPPPPHSPPAPTAPPPPPGAQPATPGAPSIANTQMAGVDEGGIVKNSGEHLVILRRGRLFSVSLAGGGLTPTDSIDAFPPGIEPGHSWYDEMLVVGDQVTVIGYSYSRGGTEINRFRLSPEGRFSFIDAHHLRANDYYSSSDYASRLIGTELIVYSPLGFGYGHDDVLDALPGVSRWVAGREGPEYRRIASSRDVHIPRPLRRVGAEQVEVMHVVYRCDLAAVELQCRANVVLGVRHAIFYVSHNAAYLWSRAPYEAGAFNLVYRFPHDGGRVTAAQVWESPLNAFAFQANAQAGRLDLLMAREGSVQDWGRDRSGVALLRLPMSRFGDGARPPVIGDYQFLPGRGQYDQLMPAHRFANGWVFYSTAAGGYNLPPVGARPAQLVAAPIERGDPVVFDFPDGIERIEPLGRDALVTGGENDVNFTTLDMSSGTPVIGPRHVQNRVSQTDSRSHAFFFRADAGGDDGLMGLPVLSHAPPHEEGGEWRPRASMLFLQRRDRALTGFGRLDSAGSMKPNDGCRVSCVDWYGNARPIFLGERVFALMGYEIVEGRATEDGMAEIARADFTPATSSRSPEATTP